MSLNPPVVLDIARESIPPAVIISYMRAYVWTVSNLLYMDYTYFVCPILCKSQYML